MPFRHKIQARRFELKYILDERLAGAIRNFLRSHLEPDEHADAENNSYAITSIYLDNADLDLYNQTMRGLKNRFKLRIRFYDDNPASPAFLEIKKRVNDVICKERAKVTREAAHRLLCGGLLDESHLVNNNGDPATGAALQNFCRLCTAIGARGRAYVTYTREAYVLPNSNQIRVTFDRELLATDYEQGTPLSFPVAGSPPPMGGVVLELKFTDRFPDWMREMVQAFCLQRTSFPKYIRCIDALNVQSRQPFGLGIGLAR
ncbi:MAG: polyphosphate polymerase domain-containing protein [Candidatus Nealsonbacteria bacterium]|nr:polyphosphate polymerase domain-containing protein [Candidatus Nealsonbacteria bacterium]